MSHQEGLSQWQFLLSSRLTHLSQPQLRVLAVWSFALVLSQRIGITWNSYALTFLFAGRPGTWRQSLREWCYDAQDKKGEHRREIDASACFAPLLAWVLDWWTPAQQKRLLLALDGTTLGNRFHILTVSVLYRGRAIPIAWQVRGARQRGAWEPIWEQLLTGLHPVVPADWQVLVLSDRGITGAALFGHIVSLGWHPFLRLTQRGRVQGPGKSSYEPMSTVLAEEGIGWCAEVRCYATVQLACTMLTGQGQGQKEPWIVITDLPPEEAKLGWYQVRFWIECGFKELKSAGWGWQNSKITKPSRMQRYILVMAVSTLWELSQAKEAEARIPQTHLECLPEQHVARRRASGRQKPRELSVASLGRLAIMCMMLTGTWQMQGQFEAFAWPEDLPAATRKRGPNKRQQRSKEGKKRWRKRYYQARKRIT